MGNNSEQTRNNGYILALGFATAVAMWTVGYIGRIPPATAPGWLLVALMALCVVLGGWCAGRFSGCGVMAGALTGLVSALINVLILGSVIGGDAGATLGIYLGASMLGSAVLGMGGAALGVQSFAASKPPVNWLAVFVGTVVYTTFLLIVAGGLVTSFEAGLAVVDWPNTEGQLMWLYPLAKMTGGIFFEHSHRLIGTLVGLAMLALALTVQVGRHPGWLKWLAWAALSLVIIQGILGGLRVTGVFTTSTSAEYTQPNLYLAVIHGVVGQLFLCLIVALGVYVSRAWRDCRSMLQHAAASTERGISLTLVILLVIQLVLGAILRHFTGGLHIHLTLAAIVITFAIMLGVRLWGIHTASPPLPLLGKYLIWTACIQLGLGFLALIATGSTADADHPPVWMVVIATAHQATGAFLLALATSTLLWTRRLLLPVRDAGG